MLVSGSGNMLTINWQREDTRQPLLLFLRHFFFLEKVLIT